MPARLATAAVIAAALVAIVAPAPARAGNGVDLVKFMPEDSTLYMVVDIAGARDSALFKLGMEKLVALAPAGFATVKAAGLDPATGLDTIAFGGRGWEGGKDSDDFTAVAEGKQAALIIDLISKDPNAKATRYHGVTYYGSDGGAIAMVSKRLFFSKAAHIERAIDLALGKIKGAARSSKSVGLRAMIAATDTRHDAWAAMVLPPDTAGMMKAQGIELTGLSMGASVSADLALELKMVNTSDASATALLAQLEQAMPQIAPSLAGMGLGAAASSVQIDRDGATVRIVCTLTAAEIQAVVGLYTSMNGGGAHGGTTP